MSMINYSDVGCIIQARMTSTRLPGKVLKIIDYKKNKTILEEVIRRVQLSKYIGKIIIATTASNEDDDIVKISEKQNVICFRGSEQDVLSRYYFAAKENKISHIVRITSDCPFIDPYVIDDLIKLYFDSKSDYCSNCLERTYPHGLDCEIFSYQALEKAYFEGEDAFFREHVTAYIYNNPEKFKLNCLKVNNKFNYKDIRITVDTLQDYILSCVLRDNLNDEDVAFRCILKLYDEKPFLKLINSDALQKKRYQTVKEEIEAAIKLLDLQEMFNATNALKVYLMREENGV